MLLVAAELVATRHPSRQILGLDLHLQRPCPAAMHLLRVAPVAVAERGQQIHCASTASVRLCPAPSNCSTEAQSSVLRILHACVRS